jgi:hypothetical protein
MNLISIVVGEKSRIYAGAAIQKSRAVIGNEALCVA